MKKCESLNHEPGLQDILLVVLELGSKTWKVIFGTSSGKKRSVDIVAGEIDTLLKEVKKAKDKFGLGNSPVLACQEAGRDGFWIHRALEKEQITSFVIDSASIEVSRRKRNPKTDRLDKEKMLTMFIRYLGGENGVWKIVNVPPEEVENSRHRSRELGALIKQKTEQTNEIRALLVTVGVRLKSLLGLTRKLDELLDWNGRKLSGDFRARLRRAAERLEFIEKQIQEIKKSNKEIIKKVEGKEGTMTHELTKIGGIGDTGATILVQEFFGWRVFRNRKEVGSAAGLTGTPFDSGESRREQGISKAGNSRIRWLMVQLAWGWLRYQEKSELSIWFTSRFGADSKRSKKVGIVALARKLLIALWRYTQNGILPKGAVFKKEYASQ